MAAAERVPRLVEVCLVKPELRDALGHCNCRCGRVHNLFREDGRKLDWCDQAKDCPTRGCNWRPGKFNGDLATISSRQLKRHIVKCFRKNHQIRAVEFVPGLSGRRPNEPATPDGTARVD
jgi:hypothetical protein